MWCEVSPVDGDRVGGADPHSQLKHIASGAGWVMLCLTCDPIGKLYPWKVIFICCLLVNAQRQTLLFEVIQLLFFIRKNYPPFHSVSNILA